MAEYPVQLQTDTIGTAPGGGIRTITATVMVNGVPTQVQMQVVAIADPAGVLIDDFATYNIQMQTLATLRRIEQLLSFQNGLPFFNHADGDVSNRQGT